MDPSDSANPSDLNAPATPDAWLRALGPLLRAEAAAEAHATGADPADLEQAVWLRLLERLAEGRPPSRPALWLRRTLRTETRRTRRTARRERPHPAEPATPARHSPERALLARHGRLALHTAVRGLPGRCPALLTALLAPTDPTYREIAGELGISQGNLGPERSRCLGCLRRMLLQCGHDDFEGCGS
ncbi:sigma-70 family RNA polymerase sigma factor [Streptomyces sp. NPDC058045]|uniref:sigma-70 family RNA polymerase sigma factor n=1 Tax=Streptomyces sp. NPDC058045 TaxID=3346311 RepID=UPI0036E5942B